MRRDRTSLPREAQTVEEGHCRGKHLPLLKPKPTPAPAPAPALPATKPVGDAPKLPLPKKKPAPAPQGRGPPPASLAPSPAQRGLAGKPEGAEGNRTGSAAGKEEEGGRREAVSGVQQADLWRASTPCLPHTPHASGGGDTLASSRASPDRGLLAALPAGGRGTGEFAGELQVQTCS